MARRPPPIATIRLARSWERLLALPAILVGASVIGAVAALLVVAPPFGVVLAVVAALPGIAGIGLALRMATMRVEVQEAAIELRWLNGLRSYALVPGPVTRVRLRGDQASSLRARSGLLGWQVGAARLRGDEPVEVVRLAPTRTAILVPTDRGRLAIAAASEPSLLDALSRAARARTRLEDLAGTEARREEVRDDTAIVDGAPAAGDRSPAAEIEAPPPHILTGIERAMLEERIARERSEGAELAQADVEAMAQAEADAIARAEAEDARLAAELAAERAAEPIPAPSPEEGVTAPAQPVAAPSERAAIPARTMAVLAVLPLVVTVGLWGIAGALGRLPEPSSEPGRLTALALVLAGPATSIGAIMARAWWPRLVTVVVTSGLASAIFIGRSLLFG